MKACVLYGARDLRIEDRPIPEPGKGMVRLKIGGIGICGSDMHFYQQGRIGSAVVSEPLVLGHECCGIIDKIGPNVSGLKEGQKVVINPSSECGVCEYCRSGRQHLCPSMRYFGAAAVKPHVQGIMMEYPLVQAKQCIPVSDGLAPELGACVEPLAIALHAVSRAGNLLGKNVFISGAGPIGSLIAAVAHVNGAASVCISDLEDFTLNIARKLGADHTFKAADQEGLNALADSCDVSFEASGSRGGMNTCLNVLRRNGIMVHVGFQGNDDVLYPINAMVIRKEVSVFGSLRAYQEFPLAARLIDSGRLDLRSYVTSTYPLTDVLEAFAVAADKSRSMKVVLTAL